MIDPRREAILVHSRKTGRTTDRTSGISWYELRQDGKIGIQFADDEYFGYGSANVRVLRDPEQVTITEDTEVEVNGSLWSNALEVRTFARSGDDWCRVFYRKQDREAYANFSASQVRILNYARPPGTAAEVLSYWKAVVSDLPEDDPLVWPHNNLKFLEESALNAYLTGAPIRSQQLTETPIYPFRCNRTQRRAVENALTHDVSVIEGPPGTGKTETILNLIANIVVKGETVGVVSHSNSAVDNLRDKLDELGFGHVVANLGNKDKRATFFSRQDDRNQQVDAFAARTPEQQPDPDRLRALDQRLRELQATERNRAELRCEAEAYRLELQHFDQHVQAHEDEIPDLAGLPLLRRTADRVLDYLAESELESSGARAGVLRRIWKYFKYGSLRGLDPADTNVILRIQRVYYDKRIAELDAEIERLDGELRRANFGELSQQHKDLSVRKLHVELGARYRGLERTEYDQKTYKRGQNFPTFLRDYPVLLSTCHSLGSSIARGSLLDYLVIDESSQVDPIVAGLALACCRNVVVVGDTKQLRPIPPKPAEDHAAPSPAHDCSKHSILSSIAEVHGELLPRTLLREHYRCDPAIIGFCNKKFYDGKLVPFTNSGDERSMVVRPTVEGNHMRRYLGHGRANQREVEVIRAEVIPEHCRGVADEDIGITTPYRLQVDRARAEDVLDQVQVDTVHKFQGRQKKVVVLTTVLDETWRGRLGLDFTDDPQLINVAVSRAVEQFVLVTNNDMMPTSRHIRDLVGHIDYQAPGQGVVDSTVVSIFDLLYRDFSDRLKSLNRRRKKQLKYPSEDIALTVLHDILREEEHAHLTAVAHVLVRNLLPDCSGLTQRQERFVRNRASVDFVIYNRITNRPLLAIEVDGDNYHANNPEQLERDARKNEIFAAHDMPLLRLPTTGSGEQQRIRDALDDAEHRSARRRAR